MSANGQNNNNKFYFKVNNHKATNGQQLQNYYLEGQITILKIIFILR